MKNVRLGIVGIGHLGAYHLKIFAEMSDRVSITGICDIKPDRTERLARHYGVPFVTDYKELAGRVDAVSICVPTEQHFEVAQFFLDQGVPTFVEKPFTKTVDQADTLNRIAHKRGTLLQVGHVERFNAGFESIKHFAGTPLFIECHRLNTFPNRSLDVGVVMDLMIHDIDIMLGIVPSAIEDIQATGLPVLTPFEDIASARISFENGCVCNLTASRVSDEPMRKIRLFQKDAYISLDYMKQEAFIYRKKNQQILKHALPIEKGQPLNKELAHFIDCIQKKTRPYVTGTEGRQALEVALRITDIINRTQRKTLAAHNLVAAP